MSENFRVGVAMKPEKQTKHISKKLLELAVDAGIDIVTMDITVPIDQNTHYDVILQKVRRPEFEEQLHLYANHHHTTRICDPPRCTHRLRNRFDMLEVASDGGFSLSSPNNVPHWPLSIKVCAPSHTRLDAGESLLDAKRKIAHMKLKYPILVKSLMADGRPGSHAMAVIHSDLGLQSIIEGRATEGLHPPVLLEQYVYHGACLFKVYVIGSQCVLVTRPSLQLSDHVHDYYGIQTRPAVDHSRETVDVPKENSGTVNAADSRGDIVPSGCEGTNNTMRSSHDNLPIQQNHQQQPMDITIPPPHIEILPGRISAYPPSRSWGRQDLAPKGHGAPRLPEWLWKGIAGHLKEKLGLTLFNFDLIVPLVPPKGYDGLLTVSSVDQDSWKESWNGEEKRGLLHIIDVNYYPGIEKLPKSEEIMIEFLKELREDKHRQE